MVLFLADECFSGPFVRALRAAGHDVVRSADTRPAASDEEVLAMAFAAGRVLLTEDHDFGDLVVRLGLPTCGVVRVHLKALDKSAQAARVVSAIAEVGDHIRDGLVTIEPTRTRVRTLK